MDGGKICRGLAIVIRELALTAFHVWGHSWGTMLAVLYALTQPQGLRSMTLASPILDISTYRQDLTNLLARQPHEVQGLGNFGAFQM